MKTLYSKGISCYASDTAGVCSALFELGGMTVVHDASGCNSTYSTFDEPRWYNTESMTYISALTENDLVCGNDGKLIDDIVRTAGELQPRFIALCCSVIPLMTGCDLDAIACAVEKRTNIPAFAITQGGLTHYTRGENMALRRLAERFLKPEDALDKNKNAVNILGATPLDFPLNGSVESIREVLSGNGFAVQSCWAMGATLEELASACRAEVNLVISSGALDLAEYMFKEYAIPFVCGVPVGMAGAESVIEALHTAIKEQCNIYTVGGRSDDLTGCRKFIVGESVFAHSLAVALQKECGWDCCVIDPLAGNKKLLLAGDMQKNSEEEIETALADAELVIADNMYEVIVPSTAQMLKIPHTAFSGRCYRKEQLNLIGRKIQWENLLCRK